MMQPKIGVVCFVSNKVNNNLYGVQATYVNAVLAAGGIPVNLPVTDHLEFIKTYADLIDGLLIPGGEDVNPLVYGEEPVPQVNYMNRTKDLFEIALVKELIAQGKPIFGICRGHQIINIALGGTLIQDIPTQYTSNISHLQAMEIRSELTHSVQVEPGSILHEIFGRDTIQVNTYHHQAVREAAPGFKVTGRAPDGIIEAMESQDGNVFSVQWHPECLYLRYPEFGGLFKKLVEKASH